MTVRLFRFMLIAGVAVGCDRGGPLVLVDAPAEVDGRGRGDGSVSDGPACGADAPFAARLVDFDFASATPTAVPGATFTVQSQPTRSGASATDGLVEMCVPVDPDDLQRVDVDAPGDYLDGVVVASPDASASFLPPMILRSITRDRAAAFYAAELGVAFDATKAHVIVLNACDGNMAELDRPHATTLAAYEQLSHAIAWSPGSSGDYILFPNVDVTQPTGIVSWGFGRPRTIPLPAGKWTMLVDCIWFL